MTLRIEMPDEQQAALNARAQARGVSAEEYIRQVLSHDLEGPHRSRKHISEIIRENMSRIPPEIMAALPENGASEHDHYIYGLSKRNR
jgi:plasmid stability protein